MVGPSAGAGNRDKRQYKGVEGNVINSTRSDLLSLRLNNILKHKYIRFHKRAKTYAMRGLTLPYLLNLV